MRYQLIKWFLNIYMIPVWSSICKTQFTCEDIKCTLFSWCPLFLFVDSKPSHHATCSLRYRKGDSGPVPHPKGVTCETEFELQLCTHNTPAVSKPRPHTCENQEIIIWAWRHKNTHQDFVPLKPSSSCASFTSISTFRVSLLWAHKNRRSFTWWVGRVLFALTVDMFPPCVVCAHCHIRALRWCLQRSCCFLAVSVS